MNRGLEFFFGRPSRIAVYIASRLFDGSLEADSAATVIEAVCGFLIGNIAGILVGLALWYSKVAFEVSRPFITALGSAPMFALAPLLVVWFGTGLYSKIMIAALSTFFVALLQAYTGAEEVSRDYLRLMASLGASKTQTFRKVVAPSAIVWVVSAMRLNVGFALLGAFIGEFISSEVGLGHMILVASGLFNMSLVLCGVLAFIVIALLLNWSIGHSEPYLKRIVVRYL